MKRESSVSYKFAGLVLVLFLFLIDHSMAQDSTDIGQPHPNTEPYQTERSIGEHVLAFPSYLLHWATRPIGYGIKYAEEEYPHWFEGKLGPYGFLPLVEVGGEQGFAGGVLLYHDHLFYPDHKARAEILFGSQIYNKFNLQYHIPIRGIDNAILSFAGKYENYPLRDYYEIGNDEELSYASEEANIRIRYNQQITSWLHTRVDVGYRDMTIKTSSYEDDLDELIPTSLLGNTKLFTMGNQWTFNYKNGRKRVLSGTQYLVGGRWTQSTEVLDLSFIEYYGEIHHFVPVPILPETRRLGLRAQLRKQQNLASQAIPFYELISLGGTRDLRGFPSNRFLAEGSLVLTAEYRYPLWDFLDMVLFVDQGQPFDNYSDLSIGEFRSSYGFGFHLLSENGLAFRWEYAFSNEGGRFIISITPNL